MRDLPSVTWVAFWKLSSVLTAKLITPAPRSTILARYLMSRRGSTTPEAFHGGADGDTIISTGSTERGTSRSDRNWRAGDRRGPEDDTDLQIVYADRLENVCRWVFLLTDPDDTQRFHLDLPVLLLLFFPPPRRFWVAATPSMCFY